MEKESDINVNIEINSKIKSRHCRMMDNTLVYLDSF